MSNVLRARGVSKRFAGIVALDAVDLEVVAGERVGLIGPNGAGKTTLFNCVLGLLPVDAGSVELAGDDVGGLPVHARARRGMGRTFQRIELFPDTTVREHLLVADRVNRGAGRLWRDVLGLGGPRPDEVDRCDEVLGLLGLGGLADQPIERLTLGQGRLVEVGRALMTLPTVLLLDEPSSGLDRSETAALAETLLEVQDERGFAVLLVEHDIELVSSFTTRCYLLDFGQVLLEGPTPSVMASGEMRHAYLGDLDVPALTPVLELRGVEAAYGAFRALFDLSITVGEGEAVALVGPNGAGKTTIARVASGLVAPVAGAVLVDGEDMAGRPPYRYARAGVAHAPEGRSVFATLTVEENLALSIRRRRGNRAVRGGLEEAYELFPVLGERHRQGAGTLSGGQQRMLSMARVLVDTPRLLIADELSLGLAPLVVHQTYGSLRKLREAGTALLVIEQQVSQALALCDRVVVLDHGAVAWAGPTDEALDHVGALLDVSGGD